MSPSWRSRALRFFPPFVADSVSTIGIVTRLTRDGFYVQDATGDGDDATSDALFVRSAATVFVGDEVRLVGVVSEYLPSNDAANLTVTEITQPLVTRLRASVPLPAAMCIELGRSVSNRRGWTVVLGKPRGDARVRARAACNSGHIRVTGVLGSGGR